MTRHARKRRHWTEREIERLARLYPDAPMARLVRAFGRPLNQVYAKAAALGLHRSEPYMREMQARVSLRLHQSGKLHRFPKGHVPANKGLRRPGWARGRMRETQFKKGGFPVNRDPEFYVLGALRVSHDGYIDMRTSFEPGTRGWRGLHLILWEDARGPLPRSHCLRFKDSDPLNVELGNLELISRAENMRRNTIHNLPKLLKDTIQLLSRLKRRIREEQDRRSA